MLPKKTSLVGEATYKYFATAVQYDLRQTSEIATLIEKTSGVSSPDVYGVLRALSLIIERQITAGYSVKLDGLGTFSLSAKSDGYTDKLKCTPKRVKPKKLCLKVDRELWKRLNEIEFVRDNRTNWESDEL
jgi:predicted histone-like DNA-binding protein